MIEQIEYEDVDRAECFTNEYELQMRLITIQKWACSLQHVSYTRTTESIAKTIDEWVREVLKFKPKEYPRDRALMTGPEISAAVCADLDCPE